MLKVLLFLLGQVKEKYLEASVMKYYAIMKEKPRLESESILSKKAGISVLVLGCLQTLLTLVAYFIGLHFYGNGTAITMAFYTLNLLQLFFMFTARTNESIFKSNPFKNKFFDFSLIFGFGILAVIATTEVKNVMKLVNLSLDCWIIVLLLSVSVIVFGEIYKAIEKRIFKKNCIRK